jgi:hypothetical protein
MDQVAQIIHHIQIMVVQLLVVVDTGKHKISMKYYILIYSILVHHQNQQINHQHLMLEQMMVMHKNVFPMLKLYQVTNFLTKIPTYVCERRICIRLKKNCINFDHNFSLHAYQSKQQSKNPTFFFSFAH